MLQCCATTFRIGYEFVFFFLKKRIRRIIYVGSSNVMIILTIRQRERKWIHFRKDVEMWQLIARRHSTVHSFVGLCGDGVGRWGRFSCRITTQRDSCSRYFDTVKTLCSLLSKNKKRTRKSFISTGGTLSSLVEIQKEKGKTLFRTKLSNGKDTQKYKWTAGWKLEREAINSTHSFFFFSLS